jgi:hypothetical protein
MPDCAGPLVARDVELARILSALDATIAGRGRLVVVAGKPGMAIVTSALDGPSVGADNLIRNEQRRPLNFRLGHNLPTYERQLRAEGPRRPLHCPRRREREPHRQMGG